MRTSWGPRHILIWKKVLNLELTLAHFRAAAVQSVMGNNSLTTNEKYSAQRLWRLFRRWVIFSVTMNELREELGRDSIWCGFFSLHEQTALSSLKHLSVKQNNDSFFNQSIAMIQYLRRDCEMLPLTGWTNIL